jgi:hypothetical protein
MAICSVCSGVFYPPWRWRDEWCPDCHQRNFAPSQERRVHEGAPLAERQRTALERLATAHARDVQACLAREAQRARMAQEDTP